MVTKYLLTSLIKSLVALSIKRHFESTIDVILFLQNYHDDRIKHKHLTFFSPLLGLNQVGLVCLHTGVPLGWQNIKKKNEPHRPLTENYLFILWLMKLSPSDNKQCFESTDFCAAPNRETVDGKDVGLNAAQ